MNSTIEGDAAPAGSAVSTTMRWASSFFTICFFLYLGFQFRRIKAFRVFSLPAAVTGGFLALIVLQLLKLDDNVWKVVKYDFIVGWSSLPSILINVVFATLFLGKKLPTMKQAWTDGGPQVMYGQIIAWGNWSVSSFITGAILIPAFGVSPLFACMYAVGFEGGHGTAAGLKESFEALGEPEYGDIAITAATIGILMGCTVGVVIVNWGIAAGKLSWENDGSHKPVQQSARASIAARGSIAAEGKGAREIQNDVYEVSERPSAGKQTVRQDAIESLALHMIYVAFSCFFGYIFLRVLWLIEDAVPALQEIRFFRSFPLFPLCMLGGLLVMWVHEKLGGVIPIDDVLMDRIGGAAMEFLIVPAIALINTDAVAANIGPLLLIMIGGISWNFFCFFFLASRILPNFPFERGIVELGQSFGTTATGLLLLRMTDPDKETPVWKSFGYKQMLTEPIMGGGVWTTLSLPALSIIGAWGVFGISSSALVFWFAMYFFYFRKQYATDAEAKVDPAQQDKEDPAQQDIELSSPVPGE